jgi:hypothetical protein
VEIRPGSGQAEVEVVAFAGGASSLDRIAGSSFLTGLEICPGLEVEISFAAKMVIQRTDAGTGQLDDVDDACIPITAVGEEVLSGLQQGAASCWGPFHVRLIT